MAYLRLSHNEAEGLTMILHLVFCKQNLPKHLGIALLWNVIWPCLQHKTHCPAFVSFDSPSLCMLCSHMWGTYEQRADANNPAEHCLRATLRWRRLVDCYVSLSRRSSSRSIDRHLTHFLLLIAGRKKVPDVFESETWQSYCHASECKSRVRCGSDIDCQRSKLSNESPVIHSWLTNAIGKPQAAWHMHHIWSWKWSTTRMKTRMTKRRWS